MNTEYSTTATIHGVTYSDKIYNELIDSLVLTEESIDERVVIMDIYKPLIDRIKKDRWFSCTIYEDNERHHEVYTSGNPSLNTIECFIRLFSVSDDTGIEVMTVNRSEAVKYINEYLEINKDYLWDGFTEHIPNIFNKLANHYKNKSKIVIGMNPATMCVGFAGRTIKDNSIFTNMLLFTPKHAIDL